MGYKLLTGLGQFQHTAARRRLEVAAEKYFNKLLGFNTQPPEGGWKWLLKSISTNS